MASIIPVAFVLAGTIFWSIGLWQYFAKKPRQVGWLVGASLGAAMTFFTLITTMMPQ